jgi:hypothetical protein
MEMTKEQAYQWLKEVKQNKKKYSRADEEGAGR